MPIISTKIGDKIHAFGGDMKCTTKRLIALIFILGIAPSIARAQAQEAGKSWLFSTSLSRATLAKFEVNLKNQGSIALEAGYMGASEALRPKEIEDVPGQSLITYGREYKIMISRYTQPTKMAGLFWGLGVGQRSIQADWKKNPNEKAVDQFQAVDEDGMVNHRLDITGTLIEGRCGYRYVSSDIGIVAGIFLDVAHHNSKVTDRDSVLEAEDSDHIAPVAESDAYAISRRLTSTLAPGFELGWAF
jgi:hypothetical protein